MPRSKGRQRPGRPCGMWPPALGSGRALGSHSKISREPLTLTTWWPGQGLVGRLLWVKTFECSLYYKMNVYFTFSCWHAFSGELV